MSPSYILSASSQPLAPSCCSRAGGARGCVCALGSEEDPVGLPSLPSLLSLAFPGAQVPAVFLHLVARHLFLVPKPAASGLLQLSLDENNRLQVNRY